MSAAYRTSPGRACPAITGVGEGSSDFAITASTKAGDDFEVVRPGSRPRPSVN